MSETTINHQKLYQDFLDKSDIVELYNHIKTPGTPETVPLNNGNKSGHAFWRGDKKRSLSLDPRGQQAYDFAENKGYNAYSLALEALGSKEEVYIQMCQVAGLNITLYERKANKTLPKPAPTQSNKSIITGLPQFYQLSDTNKEIIKEYRGIEYSKLNPDQKSIIVQNEAGEICLLYKFKGETRFYQRWLPNSDNKYMSGKGTTPKETYSLGGLNTLSNQSETMQDLYIVEGFFDMLSMQLSGFNCITKYNAKANSDLVATWIKNNAQYFNNIYLALDNDEKGIEGIEDIAKELNGELLNLNIYKAILIKPLEASKLDANDIFRERKVTFADFKVDRLQKSKQQTLENSNIQTSKHLNVQTSECLEILTWDEIANQKEAEIVENPFGLPLEKQAMTLVCALSGHGKTTALLNLSIGIVKNNQKVLYIMLEERPLTILAKLQSIYLNGYSGEITYKRKDYNLVGFHTKVIKAKPDDEITIPAGAYEEQQTFRELINSKKLSIIDATSKDVDMIIKSIEKAFSENYYDAVLIDYMQNIKPSIDKSSQIRQVQLASISSQLAPLAIKHNTSLIVGAQMRRDISSLDELDLSKIREAGDIGQDAHMAIGIWNYSDPTKNQGVALKDEVTMRCLKIRGNRFKDIRMSIDHMYWENLQKPEITISNSSDDNLKIIN